MISHVALGYILAVLAFIPFGDSALRDQHSWKLSLLMAGIGAVFVMAVGVSGRATRYVVDATVSENAAARASS